MSSQEYVRPQAAGCFGRLEEPRRFIQVVAGPRQVGKTTLVTHVADTAGLPHIFASADEPTLRGPDWIDDPVGGGPPAASRQRRAGALLVLDEVQKVPRWSEAVKRLWDETPAPVARSRSCCSGPRRFSSSKG